MSEFLASPLSVSDVPMFSDNQLRAACAKAAAAERARIREMAIDLEATVPQARVNGVVLSTVPFADLLAVNP